ncbi:MAG: EAL and GGDEF domain-containing protein [Methylococcaceae bacterium]|nr:EAL and GGDEF domain-containing protein [Methylococcaceae bacterium]
MSPALKTELLRILESKQLTSYFQPIVSITQRKIIGYEALIRGPSGNPLHSPFNLFETADRYNLSTRLEFLCREVTLARYASLNMPGKLFLNVSPSVLLAPEFKSGVTLKFMDEFGVDPRSIVIELTEHQPADDYALMRDAVDHYRNMGFEIALDDLGAGYSGLRLWSELLPDYVKIDKYFIQGIHEDPVKLNFARSILNIASSVYCNVIAEGVETEKEFLAVEKLGIKLAQGYYFARPSSVPIETIDSTLFASLATDECRLKQPVVETAEKIAKIIPAIPSTTTVSQVLELFQQNTGLTIIPLVDKNIPSGIIYREQFLTKLFSSRYGLELYGKKPISIFIDHLPLLVDRNEPLSKVSRSLTSAMSNDPAFIITDKGQYWGIGTLLDLLENITHQQMQNARHANPLTLLPGSVPINNHINQLLAEKTSFSIGYFDLDNFKPYNDSYSYSAGDEVIMAVANLLVDNIAVDYGLIGHIGGDDFIVVFTCEDWLTRCELILQSFAKLVPHYYKSEDIAAGGINAETRTGEKCFFPLISLSIGLLNPETTCHCRSHVEIADLASASKKMAKKIHGNSIFVDQRIYSSQ